jgi:hypothetical protein
MKFILYIMVTVFLETGEPLEHKFQLSFDNAKNCTEFKKVVDVGVSFFRLANEDANISTFVGQCTNVAVVNKKTKGVT